MRKNDKKLQKKVQLFFIILFTNIFIFKNIKVINNLHITNSIPIDLKQ